MSNLNNETIHLKNGNSTAITLKGLSTAGYKWDYTIKGDASIIAIDKTYAFANNNTVLPGSNADVTFTITANKTGTAVIHFFQKRTWDNSDAINEKEITVITE